MSFIVRYFRAAAWTAARRPSPAAIGWHDELFATQHAAVERGSALIGQGVVFITVAPAKGDPLDGLFVPLDAHGLRRHRHRR